MDTDLIPLDDETQLYCDIGLHGWSGMIVLQKGEPMVFSVSDVFADFPSEMVAVCNAALDNSPLRVALCDEPGGVVVEIAPDKKQHHTTLLTIYEVERTLVGFPASQEGKVVLSTRLRRERLIGMVMAELWKTHISLRQPSFQNGRQSFPHGLLREMNIRWHKSRLGPSFLTE